jgi:hypothetical protein
MSDDPKDRDDDEQGIGRLGEPSVQDAAGDPDSDVEPPGEEQPGVSPSGAGEGNVPDED